MCPCSEQWCLLERVSLKLDLLSLTFRKHWEHKLAVFGKHSIGCAKMSSWVFSTVGCCMSYMDNWSNVELFKTIKFQKSILRACLRQNIASGSIIVEFPTFSPFGTTVTPQPYSVCHRFLSHCCSRNFLANSILIDIYTW